MLMPIAYVYDIANENYNDYDADNDDNDNNYGNDWCLPSCACKGVWQITMTIMTTTTMMKIMKMMIVMMIGVYLPVPTRVFGIK